MSLLKRCFYISVFLITVASLPSTTFANDAYDPFIDYSEYDDNGDEEADVNFFKNGRQFSIHIIGGYTGLTGELGAKLFQPAVNYGLAATFFLDLRLAMQFHYVLSNHNLSFKDTLDNLYQGSSNFNDIGLDLKYYINTQNIVRNLAKLNPYAIIGFSYVIRQTKSANTAASDSEIFDEVNGYGASFGLGFEVQLSNKKFYLGGEAVYQLITFADEGTEIRPNSNPTGITPNGDLWRASVILGMNF